MRLVSVVVPDWLMATTSVSAIDDRRPKPDSSVAGRASTRRSVSVVKRASPAASAWPATAAVPWPITSTRSMAPERRPARTSSGSVSGPRLTARQAVALDQLAPQRLAEAGRRLGDLLEQEVRELAPVDVAGGDLGAGDVVVGDRQRRAVVGEPLDALERAGPARRRARRSDRGWRWGCRGWPGSRRRAAGSGASARSPRTARWPRCRRRRPRRRTGPGRCRAGRAAACRGRRWPRRRWRPSPRSWPRCCGTRWRGRRPRRRAGRRGWG